MKASATGSSFEGLLGRSGNTLKIAEQTLRSYGVVGGALDHGAEDGVEEAGKFGEGGAVAGGEGGFDGLLGGRGDEFKTPNEDASGVGGRGLDVEWENGINEQTRDDVNETRTFSEPRRFPGLEHGVSFIWK